LPRRRKAAALLPKKRPSQERSRATYDVIVDAAARVLERQGYAALTTNHVAKTAGVAVGSLYEYFDTKDAIVAEVVRRTVATVASEITAEYAAALRGSFDRNFRRFVHALFAAVEKRARLVRVVWHDVPFLWEIEEIQRLPELLLGIVRVGIPGATGSWVVRDPEAATFLLTVMVSSAVVESVITRPPQLTLAQLEEALTRFLAHALDLSAPGPA
jgi:AcrR family transcriptional regulator